MTVIHALAVLFIVVVMIGWIGVGSDEDWF